MTGALRDQGRGIALATLAGTLALLVLLAASAAPSNAGGVASETTLFSETSPGDYAVTVPDGIEVLHVVAIGARGGNGAAGTSVGTTSGGRAHQVEADITVPARDLFVNIGANGEAASAGGSGGFNGGGDGALAFAGVAQGGGGGGASDIRTILRGLAGSEASRFLVAAGGGGGGGAGQGAGGQAGGAGGDAAAAGSDGTGSPTGTRGRGGQPGTSTAVGAGGAGGNGGINGGNGTAGDPGTATGIGGDGGPSFTNTPGGEGGGGGGGYYGGGGGGGGATDTSVTGPPAGAGGGGGGSSLVPAGGTLSLVPLGTPPSITITYTTPGTAITSGPPRKLKVRKRRARVTFAFASDGGVEFHCGFDGATPGPCTSPVTRRLKLGRHRFQVFSVAGNGNQDLTPARRSFRIVRKRKR